MEAKEKVRKARLEREPEPVGAYKFTSLDGDVALADLFGDRDDLLILHNMGKGCP